MEGENKEYWLNEHGLRYWTSKEDSTLIAMRSYYWIDIVTFIDDSKGDRLYVGRTSHTEFIENKDAWSPTTKEEYNDILYEHQICVGCNKKVNECQCYDVDP